MSVPFLFDRDLQRLRLGRACAGGYAAFLVDHAADDLAERLGAVSRRFELALDLATPTPAATRSLLRSGRVAQLFRAAPVPEAGGDLVADEEALPFGPAAFDLVVSLLALQGVNDLPGALAQIRASLRPDGLLLACLFGGDTLLELRQSFIAAEAEIEGGASPRVAPFADLRDLGALLQRAGFALPVADVDRVVVRYDNPLALLRDLRAMGLTNTLAARRKFLPRATLVRALDLYAQRFADADGRARATFDLAWLSGWAPHESQQKPLKPGSAKARLAEALGAVEHKAGDVVPVPRGTR